MEAPHKSGALITAYLANDYGRDVYVLPGTLDNPKAAGCLGLMTQGAQLILGEGHLLEQLGTIPSPDPRPVTVVAPTPPLLSPDLQVVFEQIQRASQTAGGGISFDQLVQACQRPASELSGALLQLELLGLVTQLPGMRYTLTPA
jgi:DNA processing protein